LFGEESESETNSNKFSDEKNSEFKEFPHNPNQDKTSGVSLTKKKIVIQFTKFFLLLNNKIKSHRDKFLQYFTLKKEKTCQKLVSNNF
jgi:hypothetical protein